METATEQILHGKCDALAAFRTAPKKRRDESRRGRHECLRHVIVSALLLLLPGNLIGQLRSPRRTVIQSPDPRPAANPDASLAAPHATAGAAALVLNFDTLQCGEDI